MALPEPTPLVTLREDNGLTMRALQLGCRFLVGTLAHAKDKASLPAWSSLLQDGLRGCLPACRWLLLEAEAAGWLRQMLLICTVAEMRNGFSQLLLHAMRYLRPTELPLYALSELPTPPDVPMHGMPKGAPVDSSETSSSASDDESDGGALQTHSMDVDGGGGLVGATMPLPLETRARTGPRRRPEDAASESVHATGAGRCA